MRDAQAITPCGPALEKGSSACADAQLVDRLLSKSYLTEAHLSGKDREDFIAKLREIIRQDDKEWVDKEVSLVARPRRTGS